MKFQSVILMDQTVYQEHGIINYFQRLFINNCLKHTAMLINSICKEFQSDKVSCRDKMDRYADELLIGIVILIVSN